MVHSPLLYLFLMGVACVSGFAPSTGLYIVARRASAATISMVKKLEPGSTCLVLGSGPLHLLTAKQAALAGYKTCVFTAQEPDDAIELVFDGMCRGRSQANECRRPQRRAQASTLLTEPPTRCPAAAARVQRSHAQRARCR